MKLKTTYKGANGLRPSFRRAGPNTWTNLAFGAMLGVITGQYIFGEPLRQFWEESRQLEAQQQQQQQQQQQSKQTIVAMAPNDK